MKIWNYRVIKHNESVYKIHKVYYDKEGKHIDYEQIPLNLKSSSLRNLIWTLNKLIIASRKKVLEVNDFNLKKQTTNNDRTFYNS